ncbi:MAG: 50S ribosomal protein L16 [Candidatus Micrarchaeota archaeon]|nr:50S ribosomal protein L16 [Candidatus Micrarchaeota archaeon]
MGLRPARTCRGIDKMPWTRYSKKKPRKSYVKSMPHAVLHIFQMGVAGEYDTTLHIIAKQGVQIRDNSLESARQAINKYLEKVVPGHYSFKLRKYPHNIIRENKMITGAGADRLQKGMRKAYGRPTSRAAMIAKGGILFDIKTDSANLKYVNEAIRRARCKLPGKFSIVNVSGKK